MIEEAKGNKFQSEDLCSNPLFKFVDENKLNSLPTYTSIIKKKIFIFKHFQALVFLL